MARAVLLMWVALRMCTACVLAAWASTKPQPAALIDELNSAATRVFRASARFCEPVGPELQVVKVGSLVAWPNSRLDARPIALSKKMGP